MDAVEAKRTELFAILERACQLVFGRSPVKQILPSHNYIHTAKYKINNLEGCGSGDNRNVAQLMAAKSLLDKLVSEGRHNQCFPDDNFLTKSEALNFVQKIYNDALCELDSISKENWPGKCEAECNIKKIAGRPEYSFTPEDGVKNPAFLCTCRLRSEVTHGKGTSKKKAKALAAKEMYEILKSWKRPTLADVELVANPLIIVNGINQTAIDRLEQTELRGGVKDLLKGWINSDHSVHSKCPKAAILIDRIFSIKMDPELDSIWPTRDYQYYAIDENLISLTSNLAILQKQSEKLVDESKVFLCVFDNRKRPYNTFLGSGLTVIEARDMAACRAVCYLSARICKRNNL